MYSWSRVDMTHILVMQARNWAASRLIVLCAVGCGITLPPLNGMSHESIELERTFLCEIGQAMLLTFKLLNKSILKTQIECNLDDFIVFIFCQGPVYFRITTRLMLRGVLRHDADKNIGRQVGQEAQTLSAVLQVTRQYQVPYQESSY